MSLFFEAAFFFQGSSSARSLGKSAAWGKFLSWKMGTSSWQKGTMILNASLEAGLIRKEEKGVNVPPLVLLQHCNPEVPGAETLILRGRSLVPSRPAAAGPHERVPVLAAHEPQESWLKGLPAQGTSHITNPSTSERADFPSCSSLSRTDLTNRALPGLVNVCDGNPKWAVNAALRVESKGLLWW